MAVEPPVVVAEPDEITPNDRLLAALSYPIPIVAVVVLLVEDMKDRPYPRYHAIQALGYLAVWIAYNIVAGMLALCAALTIDIFGCLTWMLWPLPFILALVFAFQAYTTERYFEIPVLSQVMKDQGWLKKPGDPPTTSNAM
jgi:uncharacterized membrane protein